MAAEVLMKLKDSILFLHSSTSASKSGTWVILFVNSLHSSSLSPVSPCIRTLQTLTPLLISSARTAVNTPALSAMAYKELSALA